MKLLELLTTADKGYGDGAMAGYFDEATGKHKNGFGDTLAQFVVLELSETFDKDADTATQLSVARNMMRNTQQDLQNVIDALEDYEAQAEKEGGDPDGTASK